MISDEFKALINKRVCESTEIWKEIDNYSNYEISSYGNLRNKTTKKLFKPCFNNLYLRTLLTSDNGYRKSMTIHRLVALSFIPNPENKPTVNHKDHNTANNVLSNLEWATSVEQNQHKRKPNLETSRINIGRSIFRIDKNSDKINGMFKTTTEAARWIFDNKLTNIKDLKKALKSLTSKICQVCSKKKKYSIWF